MTTCTALHLATPGGEPFWLRIGHSYVRAELHNWTINSLESPPRLWHTGIGVSEWSKIGISHIGQELPRRVQAITRWQRIYLDRRLWKMPTRIVGTGIYALYADLGGQRLLYVGEAVDIGARLRNHLSVRANGAGGWIFRKEQYDDIVVAFRGERKAYERRMAEGRLIERFCPIWNQRR